MSFFSLVSIDANVVAVMNVAKDLYLNTLNWTYPVPKLLRHLTKQESVISGVFSYLCSAVPKVGGVANFSYDSYVQGEKHFCRN